MAEISSMRLRAHARATRSAWRSRHSSPAPPVPTARPATVAPQTPSCAERKNAWGHSHRRPKGRLRQLWRSPLRACARHHSSCITLRLRFNLLPQPGVSIIRAAPQVELARKKPGTVLYSLNHVIDFEWMREAYIRTRKDGATGIDGVTAQDYEANLEANLRDLLDRIKSGSYEAPPVRRTYIPKADAAPDGTACNLGRSRCRGHTAVPSGEGFRRRVQPPTTLVKRPSDSLVPGTDGLLIDHEPTICSAPRVGNPRRTSTMRPDSSISGRRL